MDDTPKKILMFNHEFPPIGGGGGWVSYFLGKHFAAAGHDVHLITSQFRDCPKDEKVEGFHVHRVRALRKNRDVCAVHEMLTYAVSSSLYGLRFAKQFQPDIVQVFFGILPVAAHIFCKNVATCRMSYFWGDGTYRAATLIRRIIGGYICS